MKLYDKQGFIHLRREVFMNDPQVMEMKIWLTKVKQN